VAGSPRPGFVFLVHPLVPAARRLAALRTGRVRLLTTDRPTIDDVAVICRLGFGEVEGVVVGVPLLPDELLADQARALAWMERGVQIAAPVGHVGLGSVLAVVAGRGTALAEACGLPVTTGNAATAWAATTVTRRVAAGRPVAVLGGRGAVGRAVADVLAADGLTVALDPADVSGYEVVVGAHTTGGVLAPAALHPRATLIDVALPPTLSGPPPPGVVVLAGESVALPKGWRRDGWGHLFHIVAGYGWSSVYACLLEPLIAARLGRNTPFAQGRRLDVAAVRTFGAAAEAAGFVPRIRRLQ
jgi:predicted amino acid dehydrogenase